MDLDYYGYSQDVNPDEFEALLQLEEEEMLRDLPNNFIPPSSTSTTNHLDIQIESPSGSTSTEMPFNTSSLSGLPISISNSLQTLASGSTNSRALLTELLQSASSSSSSFSTTTRNSRRSPPASIQDHIRRKGNLSVSDLVAPLWCETAFQYSILGMTNLKIEDPRRPEKIITPQGNVIVPNKARAQQKEKVLESGTKVHKQLERQVAAKPVYIKTKTREDGWGLRILKLVGSLKSLMKGGIAREVPVFGIIHGKLIIGVIDEISVATLSSKRSSGKISSSSSYSSQDGNKDSSKSPKKTWASQEDWKKEKEREKVHGKGKGREKGQKPLSFAKPSTSNPSTSTTSIEDAPLSSVLKTIMQNATSSYKDDSNLSPSSSSQKAEDQEATSNSTPVASTIAESSRPASSPDKGKGKEKEMDTTPARARYGFYLSDTKTRISARLPFPEDQKSARFQCMVYKRL